MGNALTIPVETRLTDYDMYGHMNNVAFLSLIESARFTAFGKHFDVDLSRYTGLTRKTEINYLKPAPFGTPIAIKLGVSRVGDKSVDLCFDVVDEKDHDSVFARASIAQVTYDLHKRKPCSMPDDLRNRLRELAPQREASAA